MLTPREAEVLTMRDRGLSNRQIATRLGIDPSTVANYLQHLRRKLHAKNTAHAIAQAYRCGLLTVEREGETDMTQTDAGWLQWRRAKGCESSGCPEVAFTINGRVLVRSSGTPNMVAVLDAGEWEQLRTGDFGRRP